jgi:hypothetical protein
MCTQESRYGLFSLGYIAPGRLIFRFTGKQLLPTEFDLLSLDTKLKLEAYCFEATFLINDHIKEQEIKDGYDFDSNEIQLVFDPTNKTQDMEIQDMDLNPNCGPWMNEPPRGKISNVLMQPFTFFNLDKDNWKERYVLLVRSGRVILPHEELFLHYENNYCRKSYYPGEKCPDMLST